MDRHTHKSSFNGHFPVAPVILRECCTNQS